MLRRSAVELGQRLPHHLELRLAVALKHRRIALPQELRDEVVGDTSGAEPRGERVPQLVQRKVLDPGLPQSRGFTDVGLLDGKRYSDPSLSRI